MIKNSEKPTLCKGCEFFLIKEGKPLCTQSEIHKHLGMVRQCPIGKWGDEPVTVAVRVPEEGAVQRALRNWRQRCSHAFVRAQTEIENWKLKAQSAITVEASLLIHGPVPPEVSAARMKHCLNCEILRTKQTESGNEYYCGGCGCPSSPVSRLALNSPWSKIHAPALDCPLDKFGPWEPPTAGQMEKTNENPT